MRAYIGEMLMKISRRIVGVLFCLMLLPSLAHAQYPHDSFFNGGTSLAVPCTNTTGNSSVLSQDNFEGTLQGNTTVYLPPVGATCRSGDMLRFRATQAASQSYSLSPASGTNTQCTASVTPWACCTGSGTGTCTAVNFGGKSNGGTNLPAPAGASSGAANNLDQLYSYNAVATTPQWENVTQETLPAQAAPATAGANSNITSLSGLTTAVSILQGGTGTTTGPIASGNGVYDATVDAAKINALCTGSTTPYSFCTGLHAGSATNALCDGATNDGAALNNFTLVAFKTASTACIPSHRVCAAGNGTNLSLSPGSSLVAPGTTSLITCGGGGTIAASLGATLRAISNTSCTGSVAPYTCCTGSGTGTCSTTGTFVDARNIANGTISKISVDCARSAASLCLDTSYGPIVANSWCTGSGAPYACCTGSGTGNSLGACASGVGVSINDHWTDVSVINWATEGWKAWNNNEAEFDHDLSNGYVVASPTPAQIATADARVAIDFTSPGGDVSMQNTQWWGGLLDMCSQNGSISNDSVGRGIRFNYQTPCGNHDVFSGSYIYANESSNSPLWATLNSACTGSGAPTGCCTGSGAGSCGIFGLMMNGGELVGTDPNAACTASVTPWSCCTGIDTGTCVQSALNFTLNGAVNLSSVEISAPSGNTINLANPSMTGSVTSGEAQVIVSGLSSPYNATPPLNINLPLGAGTTGIGLVNLGMNINGGTGSVPNFTTFGYNQVYSVAGTPLPASVADHTRACVSDATACTLGAYYVGSAATPCEVYSISGIWRESGGGC